MNAHTYGCQHCGKEWVIVTGPVPDHGCFECCAKFLDAVVLENYAALRLALETATREAEEERRTAEAAVKFLGRIAEVTWEAGLPSGDREQTLKNVRALASRPAPPADAAREAVRYWTFQTEWGDGYRPAAVLFQTERIASLVREQNVRLELNVGPVIAVDVPLAALSSPAPAPTAKETK